MDPIERSEDRLENRRIIDAMGPVTTHWGMKLWRLLFLEDQVVAWPYSSKESAWMGLEQVVGLIFLVKTPVETMPNFNETPHKNIERQGRFRRHLHVDIARVILRSTMNRNLIELTDTHGSSMTYGIYHRFSTERYSKLLQRTYGGAFERRDFPKSRLGKLLRP